MKDVFPAPKSPMGPASENAAPVAGNGRQNVRGPYPCRHLAFRSASARLPPPSPLSPPPAPLTPIRLTLTPLTLITHLSSPRPPTPLTFPPLAVIAHLTLTPLTPFLSHSQLSRSSALVALLVRAVARRRVYVRGRLGFGSCGFPVLLVPLLVRVVAGQRGCARGRLGFPQVPGARSFCDLLVRSAVRVRWGRRWYWCCYCDLQSVCRSCGRWRWRCYGDLLSD